VEKGESNLTKPPAVLSRRGRSTKTRDPEADCDEDFTKRGRSAATFLKGEAHEKLKESSLYDAGEKTDSTLDEGEGEDNGQLEKKKKRTKGPLLREQAGH